MKRINEHTRASVCLPRCCGCREASFALLPCLPLSPAIVLRLPPCCYCYCSRTHVSSCEHRRLPLEQPALLPVLLHSMSWSARAACLRVSVCPIDRRPTTSSSSKTRTDSLSLSRRRPSFAGRRVRIFPTPVSPFLLPDARASHTVACLRDSQPEREELPQQQPLSLSLLLPSKAAAALARVITI